MKRESNPAKKIDLEDKLSKILKKKCLIVCMGNELLGDDGIGVYIARKLLERGFSNVLNAEIYLENYIGYISALKPELILFIDAVEADMNPGDVILGKLPNIEKKIRVLTTHGLPLSMIIKLISLNLRHVEAYLLGIQVSKVALGEKMSKEVKKTGDFIVTILSSLN